VSNKVKMRQTRGEDPISVQMWKHRDQLQQVGLAVRSRDSLMSTTGLDKVILLQVHHLISCKNRSSLKVREKNSRLR
jgi:hypothetical protein